MPSTSPRRRVRLARGRLRLRRRDRASVRTTSPALRGARWASVKSASTGRPAIARTISRVAHLRDPPRRGRRAVAQDGEAIGDRADLLEEVRDVEDQSCRAPEARARGRRGARTSAAPEAARGLVEDEDAGTRSASARAISTSCCSAIAEIAHPRVEREVRRVRRRRARRARSRVVSSPVEDARSGSARAEDDVLRDRQVRAERELLVHHRDARRARLGWRARAIRGAVERRASPRRGRARRRGSS